MNDQNARESILIERIFQAPIDRVYAAWTNAQMLAQWFGPEGFVVVDVEADCQVGGEYRITIQSPDGQVIQHFGQYVEVNRPNSLAFTWILDNQECRGSADQQCTTLVTIQLAAIGTATRVSLKHEKLPDQIALDGHHYGWTSSLLALEAFLAK